MKTSLLLGALIFIGIFLQKKTKLADFNFPSFQTERNFEIQSNLSAEFHQKNKMNFSQADVSQKSISIIFQFVKTIFWPIVGVVLMMWLMMSLGIFNSLIKLNK